MQYFPERGLTSDVGRLEQRDRKRNGEQDENAGDDAFYDVRNLEFAELHEVVADPAVLLRLSCERAGAPVMQEPDMTHLDDGENGTQADSNDEHEQEHPMQRWVAFRVENGEQEEPHAADERARDGETRKDAFAAPHIGHESAAAVSFVAIKHRRHRHTAQCVSAIVR